MKFTVLLLLSLMSSVCFAKPTFLICKGTFWDKERAPQALDNLTMSIDFEAKTVTYLTGEYDITSVSEERIAAGPLVGGMRTISLNRISGDVVVMIEPNKAQFTGVCGPATKKF